jgi:hypothetical protein
MRSWRLRWSVSWAFGAVVCAALAADDPCAGFSWDVGRERALFATTAEAVPAGRDVASAPWLVPDRLYELTVAPQERVTFASPPGRNTPVDGASAGLARLSVTTAGDFRVSLDQGFWVDIVAGHELVASRDFQGRPGCRAPHKIVLYSLPGGQDLVLQVSGAAGSRLRIAITAAAAPTR